MKMAEHIDPAKDSKGKPNRVVPPQSEGEGIREHEGEAREGDEIVENFEAEIDISDDAVLRMVEHKGPVHCIAINSAATLALSGDQEDMGLLWEVKTGKLVKKLKGHTDTVIAVGWSSDEKEYATASMDGTIRVYKPSGKVKVLKGPDSEIQWFEYHKKGPVIVAGCADGTMWMWSTKTAKVMQVFAGHSDMVSCGGFSHDGKLVVSGSFDEKAIVWSPKTGQPLHKFQAKNERGFHLAPLTCIAVHPNKPIMLTGAEDGTAWVCSLSKTSSKTLKKLAEHKQSVESAEFSSTLNFVFTASADGTIIVSDYGTGAMRTKVEHQGAITQALWNPAAPVILATGTDTLLRMWDARNGSCIRELKGHSDTVLALAVSRDGRLAVTGSDDATCALFALGANSRKNLNSNQNEKKNSRNKKLKAVSEESKANNLKVEKNTESSERTLKK
ncbi:hypothetical protein AAMO2058_000146400 [Amorphochlora amoebiformis]